mmetsp:Transcript_7894/g.20069  ORF Transcript_7894/g.20069 Transcript_7894/m.20069 type:complete len:215 (+) Transcript_7894:87-731(+)
MLNPLASLGAASASTLATVTASSSASASAASSGARMWQGPHQVVPKLSTSASAPSISCTSAVSASHCSSAPPPPPPPPSAAAAAASPRRLFILRVGLPAPTLPFIAPPVTFAALKFRDVTAAAVAAAEAAVEAEAAAAPPSPPKRCCCRALQFFHCLLHRGRGNARPLAAPPTTRVAPPTTRVEGVDRVAIGATLPLSVSLSARTGGVLCVCVT